MRLIQIVKFVPECVSSVPAVWPVCLGGSRESDVGFLRRMKLGTMLGMGFLAVIVVCVCVAGFGWMKLHDQGEQLRVLAEDRMGNLARLQSLKDNANVSARVVRNLALITDPAQMAE